MAKFIETAGEFVWGTPTIALLLGTGLYLNLLLKWLPLRMLPRAIKMAIFSGERKGQESGDGVSSFSSLATELAATIGTGNIVGVVSAITLGGPGAILWMSLSAILGLATKLVESTLSVKYRIKGAGLPVGGPMITMKRAFPWPRLGKVLSVVYAALALCTCMGMGNLVQANSIANSLITSFHVTRRGVAIGLMILTLLAILGGIRAIAKISTFFVPAMGAIYLAGCLGIILTHLENLLPALGSIFLGAFDGKAVCGGLFGTVACSAWRSITVGISRGVFSNEAGLGVAGISAATSKESSCVRQGMISMTGVFFDTLVICTFTGIAYCVSGVAAKAANGTFLFDGTYVSAENASGLMAAAFETTYGRFGGVTLSACITMFAYATILGWAAQGETVFAFLFGEKNRRFFRVPYVIVTYLGTMTAISTAWDFCDLTNGLMIFPNLLCVLVLALDARNEIEKEWNRSQGRNCC